MMIWNQPAIYSTSMAKMVPIGSPALGRVMAVCVGAMMVGSMYTTVKEGEHVKHGQEFGYFAFGMYSQIETLISSSDTLCSDGSTIVLLF